jgi:hypothetical protein
MKLDLKIQTPQIFDALIGKPAAEVAGAVELRAQLIGKRVGYKLFCSQFRAIHITPAHLDASNVKLAGNANRNGLLM